MIKIFKNPFYPIFSLFLLVSISLAGCATYPAATISGTVSKEITLSNYNGEPYLLDMVNNKMYLYSSIEKEEGFDYIKYRLNTATGSCTEVVKESGTKKYKNYFWDEILEEDRGPGFCMAVLLAYFGSSEKEYTVQLTKVIDKANTMRYLFWGKTTTTGAGSVYASTQDANKSGVIFKKGDHISTMVVTDPLGQDTWQLPLANKVDFPFLSKFYYLDNKSNKFIATFADGMVFLGDKNMISIKQRMIPVNKDKTRPFIDLVVNKKEGKYYWLRVAIPAKNKEEKAVYKIDIRTLDSITASLSLIHSKQYAQK